MVRSVKLCLIVLFLTLPALSQYLSTEPTAENNNFTKDSFLSSPSGLNRLQLLDNCSLLIQKYNRTSE